MHDDLIAAIDGELRPCHLSRGWLWLWNERCAVCLLMK
jgi:hypothetical protein